ncbi:hypothetical protein CYMTET_25051 [Cymbomonas tetramitiformis]|uniref:Uncharacterized protein n=1 Tax=Cymbomonas tetramitiformis TaxID=36881 RepID=A0AAE0KZA5_9CHLO|nr:hypothetical protein CYMTET_25051 [Cymbomonas tetramitiformis]
MRSAGLIDRVNKDACHRQLAANGVEPPQQKDYYQNRNQNQNQNQNQRPPAPPPPGPQGPQATPFPQAHQAPPPQQPATKPPTPSADSLAQAKALHEVNLLRVQEKAEADRKIAELETQALKLQVQQARESAERNKRKCEQAEALAAKAGNAIKPVIPLARPTIPRTRHPLTKVVKFNLDAADDFTIPPAADSRTTPAYSPSPAKPVFITDTCDLEPPEAMEPFAGAYAPSDAFVELGPLPTPEIVLMPGTDMEAPVETFTEPLPKRTKRKSANPTLLLDAEMATWKQTHTAELDRIRKEYPKDDSEKMTALTNLIKSHSIEIVGPLPGLKQ